jgi:hypothetical protein
VDSDDTGPVLYAEAGTSWWPLVWGPVFALVGFGVEALTGPASATVWGLVCLGLLVVSALWVQGRRRVYAVRLTPSVLWQGQEVLRVAEVGAVDGVERRAGAKVLGGSYDIPRGTTAVPIRLADGSVVLGWARDGDALRQALHRLLPS